MSWKPNVCFEMIQGGVTPGNEFPQCLVWRQSRADNDQRPKFHWQKRMTWMGCCKILRDSFLHEHDPVFSVSCCVPTSPFSWSFWSLSFCSSFLCMCSRKIPELGDLMLPCVYYMSLCSMCLCLVSQGVWSHRRRLHSCATNWNARALSPPHWLKSTLVSFLPGVQLQAWCTFVSHRSQVILT